MNKNRAALVFLNSKLESVVIVDTAPTAKPQSSRRILKAVFSTTFRKLSSKNKLIALQMFTGVFPAISMEKGCKNHRETLYSSKGKIVYVLGKPRNIYRLLGNPIVIIGFSPQSLNITGFPHNIHNLSL